MKKIQKLRQIEDNIKCWSFSVLSIIMKNNCSVELLLNACLRDLLILPHKVKNCKEKQGYEKMLVLVLNMPFWKFSCIGFIEKCSPKRCTQQ